MSGASGSATRIVSSRTVRKSLPLFELKAPGTFCHKVTKYSKETIFYTLFELDDGGYINISKFGGDDTFENCCVNYITYAGHEFINTIRSNPTWAKTLEVVGTVGNFGLQMLAKIAEGVATTLIKQQLGLS